MRQAGEVTYADAHKQNRNEGVVEFASYSDMKNAYKKLNGAKLNGRRIHLTIDHPGHDDRRSYSRSNSMSRSRSSSHSHSPHQSRSHSSFPCHNRNDSHSHSRSQSPRRTTNRNASKSLSKSPSCLIQDCRLDLNLLLPIKEANSKSESQYKSVSRSQSRSPECN
ncbi:hypothetical protein CEXT_659851 [Caerostris extrusa]|uniref:RRM domain-containing protein n=1 Tax=Caerostris extrusa TaxID=172846 RepID=A0AAV4MAM7_CAEEX|nr:hypothetical protein CEXT_659851 [Caerostris extrusa]